MQSFYTFHEINTQAVAWNDALKTISAHQETLKRLWQEGGYDYVVFTGCGSTYYLALSAANLAQSHLNVVSRAAPASELLLHPESIYAPNSRPLLVAVSRSAATTETIQAAQAFRARYGDHVIVISCHDNQPLNAQATLTLAVPTAQERSLAQTRSFSSMLVAAEGMVRILTGQPIDQRAFDGDSLVAQANHAAVRLADLQTFDRYFYLGSGPRYGLACEGMLKMKEMSQTYAEAYHPMEFRHGPKSMVNERTLVIGLLDKSGYEHEQAVLDEMARLGATTVNISPNPDADFRIAERHGAPLVRYLPLMQWMAYHRAVSKRLNPDQPHNLDMVVQL
jgi:glucosamine--fructose-6-phosphate aminotransferase (isomerizing)